MTEKILLKPEIDRFTELAWKFQQKRKTAKGKKIQAKMYAEITAVLSELKVLSDRLESGCGLMDSVEQTRQKKVASRGTAHTKRTSNRKDIFSIHNYVQPK